MSLEASLREISVGLQSTRRKKSAERLNEYLNMESVQSMLTNNTLMNNKHYSWNDLFHDIHSYILKETEKCESKTFEKTTAPLATTILNLCVARANKGKAYIKCDIITDACLMILKDVRLKMAIGDAYLNLLYKHVLSQEYYLRSMTTSTWEDLLHVSLSTCTSKYSKLDSYAKLRLVLLVIKNAKHYTQFTIPLRDALPKWNKCVLKTAQDKKAQEVIVEIVLVLLETLSAECRLTLCHFMEGILPTLIQYKFYDQNMDLKKKCLLFQLLLYNVTLHHPLGRTRHQEGSLADDWDVWSRQLNSIQEIIALEVSFLQKSRKHTEEVLKQYDCFYKLAAAVYLQMFSLAESSESDVESVPKRQKLTCNEKKTFGDLIDELRQNYVPWLGIIHEYVKNNISSIVVDENINLMNAIQNLFTGNTLVSWEILEELTCTVLRQLASNMPGRDDCESIIVSVWNHHVRNSTTPNTSHKTSHKIMQCILTLDVLTYENTKSLFKFYREKNMPVTSDSVMTLRTLFHKFYNKYSHYDIRSDCFSWLTQGDITSVEIFCLKELILSLIFNENIDLSKSLDTSLNNLYDTLYSSNEKCILFNQFELELENSRTVVQSPRKECEIIPEIEKQMSDYFRLEMLRISGEHISNVKNKYSSLIEYMKFINVMIVYLDIAYRDDSEGQLELFQIQNTLKHMYTFIENALKCEDQVHLKVKILKALKDILLTDVKIEMSSEIRSHIPGQLLDIIKRNMLIKVKADDEEIVYASDEKDDSEKTLKHTCIMVLAAYCTKSSDRRDSILKFILNHKNYDFEVDAQCLFRCIELLTGTNMPDPPIKSIFNLMQEMCRALYKDPVVSCELIKNVLKMLDTVWCPSNNLSVTKQNCLILLKSYVSLCGKQYYPPNVAALIYECIARTAYLNRKYNLEVDEAFESAMMGKIKGNIHSLRIYCCYLLKLFIRDCPESDTEILLSELSEIFRIDVAEGQQQFLKDELTNRTLTVLHCYLALAQTKNVLIHQLVTGILSLQKEKSLDKTLVKKSLKEIGNAAGVTNFDKYLENNIVSILYFWFTNGNSIEDLPVPLLGTNSLDDFKEQHKNWLIPADIIWLRNGNVHDSDFLKQMKENQSAKDIIESSFLNIVVLCMPYIVTEKYGLNYKGLESVEKFKKSAASAHNLFKLTSEILEHGKWSKLFVENLGKLVLLTAMNIFDQREAKKMFSIDIPEKIRPYGYTMAVFSAILNCFGEITRKDIIQYLCENQPMAIFQVLFRTWKTVLDENVIEFKVIALHAFIAFFQVIPLDLSSDAFVCSFVCNSFARGIKESRTSEELRVFSIGTKIVLEKLLERKLEVVQKTVSQLIPVLIMRKDEHESCSALLEYLTVDMKNYLSPSEDVVDFIQLSQHDRGDGVADYSCSTKLSFTEKVKAQITNLICPSSDMLLKLHRLLKANKHYVKALYQDIDPKGFSEVCDSSIVHQLVYALNNILKSVYYDEKIIIEACNCLSEVGTYDLKTLVTVPPLNTQRIVELDPKHYMACVVLRSLSEVLFDGDPDLTHKVAQTLNTLFKFRVGCNALDLEHVDRHILKPLTAQDSNKSKETKISSRKFDQYCAENSEGIFIKALTSHWDPNDNSNHCKWLKRVTTSLLQLLDSTSNYFEDLMQVCSLKSSVCRKIMPALVGLIVQCSTENHLEIICKHINNVFEYIWEQTFDNRMENSGDSTQIIDRKSALDVRQKMVIQYMLEIVDFVRLQRPYYKARPGRGVESLNYLRLEYDKVSWAATVADQSLAAIYYGELWAVHHNKGVPPPSPDATTALPGGENLQRIFRKCYICIGELDAIDGCGTAHLTIESEKRGHLVSTGQYADALLLHDIALSSESSASPALHRDAVASLHKSGMHHLALRYINSLPQTELLDDIKYECMAFLGDWSEIVDTRYLEEKSKLPNSNPVSIIKAFHYACLKDCLNVQNEFKNKLVVPMNRAKLAVSRLSQKLNMENCQSVYQVVSKLHLFSDIEDYISMRTNEISPRDLISKWGVDNLPPSSHFKHMESLISQRVLILEHAAKMHHELQDEIVSLQIQYAKLGLSNNRVQMSQRLLAIVKKLQKSEEVALLESEIAWAKGHKDIALSLLRNIVTNETQDVNLTARSLRQYALWMSETKRDNPRDIIDKYLLKSLNVMGSSHGDTSLKIYHDIAKFADAEYKQVVTYMSSTVYENKVQCLENMKGTMSSLKSTQNLNNDGMKVLRTHERFKALDEDDIRNTQIEKESFLKLAMRYYLLSLKQSEENNLSIFRVISLWLENPAFEFDTSQYTLFSLLSEIPSRKFIAVLPQLAPRLTTEDNKFAKILRGIIRKCAIEHPHHTLPILFALKNSEKDKGLLSSEPRTLAAQALVQELATLDGHVATIIEQMELVCDAIISFANYELKTRDTRIPASQQIHKLRNLDAIPIPTVTMPIRNDCRYRNFPTLHAFENTFELVGGINCPKKIVCTDSNGKKRILLIKGKDDMRQDAVMQQVFSIVNMLLEKNPVTSRNKLLIRTYKVVPMSKQSGVLEWCEGTLPLGVYLAGSRTTPGAHARYRPKDIPCQTAREKLVECYNARKSNKEKLTVFMRILKEFKPVFHYFFTEHYLDPVTWYERRLAYTKSVATSSMVGYIMGLGDRHVQNILIDKRTAEVIHIDFGIAFDLGKTLPTPETIPFRLTQDIIAGFGCSGVEGIFRGCCEKSMQLLRENAETLLTILEVLLCDPLYNWTLSTAQQHDNSAADISRTGGGADSGLAKRALLAVSSKLSGTEGGAVGGQAVAGQVARLLREAVDPANLCRLFHGWQPYL